MIFEKLDDELQYVCSYVCAMKTHEVTCKDNLKNVADFALKEWVLRGYADTNPLKKITASYELVVGYNRNHVLLSVVMEGKKMVKALASYELDCTPEQQEKLIKELKVEKQTPVVKTLAKKESAQKEVKDGRKRKTADK